MENEDEAIKIDREHFEKDSPEVYLWLDGPNGQASCTLEEWMEHRRNERAPKS